MSIYGQARLDSMLKVHYCTQSCMSYAYFLDCVCSCAIQWFLTVVKMLYGMVWWGEPMNNFPSWFVFTCLCVSLCDSKCASLVKSHIVSGYLSHPDEHLWRVDMKHRVRQRHRDKQCDCSCNNLKEKISPFFKHLLYDLLREVTVRLHTHTKVL